MARLPPPLAGCYACLLLVELWLMWNLILAPACAATPRDPVCVAAGLGMLCCALFQAVVLPLTAVDDAQQ